MRKKGSNKRLKETFLVGGPYHAALTQVLRSFPSLENKLQGEETEFDAYWWGIGFGNGGQALGGASLRDKWLFKDHVGDMFRETKHTIEGGEVVEPQCCLNLAQGKEPMPESASDRCILFGRDCAPYPCQDKDYAEAHRAECFGDE